MLNVFFYYNPIISTKTIEIKEEKEEKNNKTAKPDNLIKKDSVTYSDDSSRNLESSGSK